MVGWVCSLGRSGQGWRIAGCEAIAFHQMRTSWDVKQWHGNFHGFKSFVQVMPCPLGEQDYLSRKPSNRFSCKVLRVLARVFPWFRNNQLTKGQKARGELHGQSPQEIEWVVLLKLETFKLSCHKQTI
jgi:hypothetical protein